MRQEKKHIRRIMTYLNEHSPHGIKKLSTNTCIIFVGRFFGGSKANVLARYASAKNAWVRCNILILTVLWGVGCIFGFSFYKCKD